MTICQLKTPVSLVVGREQPSAPASLWGRRMKAITPCGKQQLGTSAEFTVNHATQVRNLVDMDDSSAKDQTLQLSK